MYIVGAMSYGVAQNNNSQQVRRKKVICLNLTIIKKETKQTNY